VDKQSCNDRWGEKLGQVVILKCGPDLQKLDQLCRKNHTISGERKGEKKKKEEIVGEVEYANRRAERRKKCETHVGHRAQMEIKFTDPTEKKEGDYDVS